MSAEKPLRHVLTAHRSQPVPAGWHIEVVTRWSPGGMLLEYTMGVPAGRLVLAPRSETPAARDFLWKRTCGELFLGVPGDPSYLEFNFSPSGDWAAYAFDGYRTGVRNHDWIGQTPEVRILPGEGATRLLATVPHAALRPLWRKDSALTWQAGITMVLETHLGLSYWSLAHPRTQPEFHDRAGFVGGISVPEDLF